MPSQIIKVVGPQGEPLAAAKAFVNGLPLPPSGADGQFFAATYQGIPVGRKQKSPRAREPRSDQKASNSDPERKSDLGCARAERDLRRGCLNGAGDTGGPKEPRPMESQQIKLPAPRRWLLRRMRDRRGVQARTIELAAGC